MDYEHQLDVLLQFIVVCYNRLHSPSELGIVDETATVDTCQSIGHAKPTIGICHLSVCNYLGDAAIHMLKETVNFEMYKVIIINQIAYIIHIFTHW